MGAKFWASRSIYSVIRNSKKSSGQQLRLECFSINGRPHFLCFTFHWFQKKVSYVSAVTLGTPGISYIVFQIQIKLYDNMPCIVTLKGLTSLYIFPYGHIGNKQLNLHSDPDPSDSIFPFSYSGVSSWTEMVEWVKKHAKCHNETYCFVH